MKITHWLFAPIAAPQTSLALPKIKVKASSAP
jgi:hypothetical protein